MTKEGISTVFRLGLPAFFALTSLIGIIAAGVLWYWLNWQRKDASIIERCVVETLSRDPIADVQNDLSKGENRFFFVGHNGEVGYSTADGVRVPGYKGNAADLCEPKHPAAPDRLPLSAKFSAYFIKSGNHCCDYDPPKTACGIAVASYIRSYNREMAQANPSSISRYCEK